MLGSPILYLKGMGILMFQLSGFYCMFCTRAPISRVTNKLRSRLGSRIFGFSTEVEALGFGVRSS